MSFITFIALATVFTGEPINPVPPSAAFLSTYITAGNIESSNLAVLVSPGNRLKYALNAAAESPGFINP